MVAPGCLWSQDGRVFLLRKTLKDIAAVSRDGHRPTDIVYLAVGGLSCNIHAGRAGVG